MILNLTAEEIVDIPQGGIYGIDQKSNLVVFWGLPHSGRTSAIFSILSQKGFDIFRPYNDNLNSRIEKILDIFSSQDAIHVPPLSQDDISEIYHARYSRRFSVRSYKISFFKPKQDFNDSEVFSILEKHSEQIHVFCIDCDKNNQDLAYISHQVEYHEKVISLLKSHGIFQKSNAIYLLVTKTDLMNVPDIYEENAAQTFVTSGLSDFWHKIKEICYAKDIYNAQPIVFSIGNFILKDFTRLDTDYAKIFLEESIIPKCQPNQNFIEKIISKGKSKYTPYLVVVVLLLIFYGIIYVFSAIVPPPERKVVTFSYNNYFAKQENGLTKKPISEAENLYQSLRQDLNVENALRLSNGEKVLPYNIYKQCDSVLINDFSIVLRQELEELFSSKRWTSNETLLKKRDGQIVELLSHSSLRAASIRSYHDYIYHYFYQIKPLLARSKRCMTVQDVRTVVSQVVQWKKYPYNKDTKLNKALSDAKINAYQSCANNYQRLANQKIREYNNEVSRSSTIISWFFSTETHDELKRNFKEKTSMLVNNINKLISDLSSSSDSRLVAIRKSLEKTKSSLVNITNNKTSSYEK